MGWRTGRSVASSTTSLLVGAQTRFDRTSFHRFRGRLDLTSLPTLVLTKIEPGENPRRGGAVRVALSRLRHDQEVGWSEEELQGRIKEVTVDAYGDDEQLESFACVLDELLERPLPATVLGAAVEVLSVETGGYRQGLRARCRGGGQQWEVTLVDVTFGPGVDPELALTLAAYRRWLGDDFG